MRASSSPRRSDPTRRAALGTLLTVRSPLPSAGALLGLVLVVTACSGSARGAGPSSEPAPPAATWWPAFAGPDRSVPVASLRLPNGGWIVADRVQNRLFRVAGPDTLPVRLPSPGSGPVEWTALSLAPGLSFYALDGPGRKIHQYDWRGNYLGEALDLARVAEDQDLGPVEPAGLAVDRAGHALVSDRMGDRLLAFGPGWAFLGVWGQTGSDPGSWRRPGAIAVSGRNAYIVADEGNRRVVALDELGNVTAVRELEETPRGVAALDETRFAAAAGPRVEILDPGLRVVDTFAVIAGPGCTGTPYATPALAGDARVILVGEGCSGRLAVFALPDR